MADDQKTPSPEAWEFVGQAARAADAAGITMGQAMKFMGELAEIQRRDAALARELVGPGAPTRTM